MIGREYLASTVDSFFLILSRSVTLSTIPFFGAKLISLYLFLAKKRGKLSNYL